MSTNLAVALEFAAAGIPVFPAGVYQQTRSSKWQKKPLIEDWQKCATTNREQIRQWWARHPHAVPGIWRGHPDLNFIMLDRHGGPDGVDAPRALRGLRILLKIALRTFGLRTNDAREEAQERQ
jgi:Bifunctional DNA primase/polymerase, N-terminal